MSCLLSEFLTAWRQTHTARDTLSSQVESTCICQNTLHMCACIKDFFMEVFLFLSVCLGEEAEWLNIYFSSSSEQGKTHFLYISFSLQTQFYRVPVRAMRCPINPRAAKWMSVCTSAVHVFPLTLAAISTAVCSSTTPGMFPYRRLCCALLCPHVRLNGGHYWPIPHQVSVACFQLRFLDVIYI